MKVRVVIGDKSGEAADYRHLGNGSHSVFKKESEPGPKQGDRNSP
ncbi:hypothetical protein pdam_00018736, partial [Pocillopora damicornis]